MARFNETGAHLALCETVREVNPARIGAHFHKPAPVRAARRVSWGPMLGAFVAFAAPAAALVLVLVP